ncbi:hypothetical protein L1049_007037 [Liquidambar formosana]|uniref:Uncharacterized protein n=1 Tax=Liquidambar formosana TaxID=63359 RepID=A0AAP0WUW9_LIQFO
MGEGPDSATQACCGKLEPIWSHWRLGKSIAGGAHCCGLTKERNGHDCKFFAWCEPMDGVHITDDDASSTFAADIVHVDGRYNSILPTSIEWRIIVRVLTILMLLFLSVL